MSDKPVIRLCEWSAVSVANRLTAEQCDAITTTVDGWQAAGNLPQPPLKFSGPRGDVLEAIQHVGVVEVGGCAIEIYPKLDAGLIDKNEASGEQTRPVMDRLLWMLHSCGYMDLTESDTAHLSHTGADYIDLFAYLMARNLFTELERGVAHAYIGHEDDLRAVRGSINLNDQLTRNWNRFDRIACRWDEFSPDTPLNQIFKCACRILQTRVQNPAPALLLDECCFILDEVSDITVHDALQLARNLRWNRSNDRFRRCFDMATRMLSGSGYQLGHGDGDSFVFLLDMNDVFERFTAAAISAHFNVTVSEQKVIGKLFKNPSSINQKPDFLWTFQGQDWIGDAKYKHFAKGSIDSIIFDSDDQNADTQTTPIAADRVLSPDDIRQLTVYAELRNRPPENKSISSLAILYPFIGNGEFKASHGTAWNDSKFWLIPVKLNGEDSNLSSVLPELEEGPVAQHAFGAPRNE
jgi:hypothetical protein